MNSEAESGSSERKPLTIGGKIIDFSKILEDGGQSHIETTPRSGKFIDISVTPHSIEIHPKDESPFLLRAQVSPISGDLEMNINVKDKEGNRHPDLPNGGTFVDGAINFLDSHQKIDHFTGTWKENSDNFSQFLRDTNSHGMSPEDAAFNNWTGKNVAKKFGFKYITNIFKNMYGDERYVIVKFSRIPPSAQ